MVVKRKAAKALRSLSAGPNLPRRQYDNFLKNDSAMRGFQGSEQITGRPLPINLSGVLRSIVCMYAQFFP